jgi:cell wall-associated NlpC family hydrolase
VRLANGQSSRPTAADLFTFTVPTMRTPAHDGLSTLQSRARAAQVIWRVNRTPAADLAPLTPSWSPAEGVSAVRRAERWLGMPYSWGGGNASGPTRGSRYGNGLLGRFDATFRGFDCSGLVQHAWAPYLRLPHHAASQRAAAGLFHPTVDELQAGDLLFFSGGGSVIGHVVVYAGNGQVVQAPESGHVVELSSLDAVLALEPRSFGATRPASTAVAGPSPTITSLSITQGSTTGGETLTIEGTDLDTTSSVRFGSQRTYAVTVLSPTQVQVTVPPGADGTVPVVLGNAWGVSPDTPADDYTYTGSPGSPGSPGSTMAPGVDRR